MSFLQYSRPLVLLLLILFPFSATAVTYTFTTSGDYSDMSNWDTYPGDYVENGDTLLIQENININVILDVYDGVVLFESNVEEVEMNYVTIWYDSLLKIEANYFELNIEGRLDFEGGNIEYPNLFDVIITNTGNGIYGGGNVFAYGPTIDYSNYGTQESLFFNDFQGYFFNEGIILVEYGNLYLNCDLDLFSGTIEGYSAFEIIQEEGSISQSCSSCTSSTINCTKVSVNNLEIEGSWIID